MIFQFTFEGGKMFSPFEESSTYRKIKVIPLESSFVRHPIACPCQECYPEQDFVMCVPYSDVPRLGCDDDTVQVRPLLGEKEMDEELNKCRLREISGNDSYIGRYLAMTNVK